MLKLSWHDSAWHNFFAREDVRAVEYALQFKTFGDTDVNILKEANNFHVTMKLSKLKEDV